MRVTSSIAPRAAWRSRAWAIVAALSVTETVSWGILYYAFAVLLVPMQRDLGLSAAQLTGAFSAGLLVSGAAGIAVGRHLDRRSPRALMTAGSLAGVALVLAWSQVHALPALYAVWAGLGLAMAAVLYEPAFVVLAKHFPDPGERRRAITVLTLTGALASFVFVPLAQALVDAYGWRDALVVLAAVLAVVTVPLHALVLRPAPVPAPARVDGDPGHAAGPVLRSPSFWLLSTAFVLASLTAVAMTVHTIPYLLERGHSPAFAAFAVGLVGIAQIPGRLVFAVAAARLTPEQAAATVLGVVALGVAVVAGAPSGAAVLAGLVLLGMGQGTTTLARAMIVADRFGVAAYGTIASVAAAMTTAARAAGPVVAALGAAAVGYGTTLWLLAGLAMAGAGLAASAGRPSARMAVA